MNNAPIQPIQKSSTVKYQGGFYRVSARYTNSVNLASIFGAKIYFKRIPLSDVTEAYAEWNDQWTKSETYQSM